MKRRYKYLLWLMVCIPGMISCDEYLDMKPSKTS